MECLLSECLALFAAGGQQATPRVMERLRSVARVLRRFDYERIRIASVAGQNCRPPARRVRQHLATAFPSTGGSAAIPNTLSEVRSIATGNVSVRSAPRTVSQQNTVRQGT